MRVLLIQSYLGGSEPPVFPMGLACLKAALVSRGHEVSGFDPNIAGLHADYRPALAAAIEAHAPEVVGVSLRNIDSTNKRVVVFYYALFRELLTAVREHTRAPLVVGGSGFSMFAETIMRREPRIDYGVFLEGEHAFPLLLEKLAAPEATPWERVPQLFHREGDMVHFTGEGPKVDMTATPPPDMTVVDLADYRARPEAVGVESKRGCGMACVYCPYGFLNGRSCRLKEPERLVDELARLAEDHHVTSFTFTDSIFNAPAHHARAVCEAMVRRDVRLRWSAWFSERELTSDFLELALEAGCRNVILSPDGFSDDVLEALRKHLTKREILAAYEAASTIAARPEGFELSYNFFKNPPGQSLTAFLEMARFIVQAKWRLRGKVHFELNSLRVEPHTSLHQIALADGQVAPNDDLLEPRYYTQRRTAYLERLVNLLLRLRGK